MRKQGSQRQKAARAIRNKNKSMQVSCTSYPQGLHDVFSNARFLLRATGLAAPQARFWNSIPDHAMQSDGGRTGIRGPYAGLDITVSQ